MLNINRCAVVVHLHKRVNSGIGIFVRSESTKIPVEIARKTKRLKNIKEQSKQLSGHGRSTI
jgi:hypothetical protein